MKNKIILVSIIFVFISLCSLYYITSLLTKPVASVGEFLSCVSGLSKNVFILYNNRTYIRAEVDRPTEKFLCNSFFILKKIKTVRLSYAQYSKINKLIQNYDKTYDPNNQPKPIYGTVGTYRIDTAHTTYITPFINDKDAVYDLIVELSKLSYLFE